MESFLIAEAQLPSPHVYVYRTVDGVAIEADVFLPATEFSKSQCPLFLFIHGGGWMAGTRKDVNGPMLHEFLQRGFVVTSIDYRLFLEITMQEQLDDIRKVEDWARVDLPAEAKQLGFELMPDKVIVGGSSAGGHLALMVPHLWQQPPLALLVLYSPTDLTTIKPREQAIETLKDVPPITPEIVKAAIFDTPRTSFLPNRPDAEVAPRTHIAYEVTRSGGIGEILAAGPTSNFELRKPSSLSLEAIVSISPALLPLTNYPPVFHAIGTEDLAFETNQATEFAEKLQAARVACETMILDGALHAFDEKTKIGGEVHLKVMVPAADFVCQTLNTPADKISSRGIVIMDAPKDSVKVS